MSSGVASPSWVPNTLVTAACSDSLMSLAG